MILCLNEGRICYQKLNNQRISNKLHVYLHLCNNYSAYVSQVTTCFFSD